MVAKALRSVPEQVMSKIEQRLTELGITLPQAAPAAANYVPFVISANHLFVAGQLPAGPDGLGHTGKLGEDMHVEEGQAAARLCGLNILAQAKAANTCGQTILMRSFGVTPAEIQRLYLAGAFANYVDPQAAVEIGFLAPVPADRIVKVGNAAIQGARELLLSGSKRRAIEQLIARIEHVELETMPDFFDVFVEGCQFKPMQIPAGPAAS